MTIARHFEIRYRLNGERKMFVQPDSRMSEADAWYYACLHAGIGVLHNRPSLRDETTALKQHAERAGVTEVIWEK
jgi:hypothetical protein